MPDTALTKVAQDDLVNALDAWDWTNYFPDDYDPSLPRGVDIRADWSWLQILSDQSKSQFMQIPIISVLPLPITIAGSGSGATLGGVMGAGKNPGTVRYGQILNLMWQVDCWTDEQIGAGDQANRLGAGLMDCLFYNQNRLPVLRRINCTGGRLSQESNPQLWRVIYNVTGQVEQSYDA